MIDNLIMLIIGEQVKQINQLKQTLKEIKDIAESNICSNCDTTSICKRMYMQTCGWKQILQIIDKVE